MKKDHTSLLIFFEDRDQETPESKKVLGSSREKSMGEGYKTATDPQQLERMVKKSYQRKHSEKEARKDRLKCELKKQRLDYKDFG